MALITGTSLGPYEVLSPLGVGGRGEVYSARDKRLNREVAINVLPEPFLTDPQRLARFRREAQVLTSFNHLFPDKFESPQGSGHTAYDVFPDGRLLMIKSNTRGARQGQIVLVYNWFEELKKEVPAIGE